MPLRAFFLTGSHASHLHVVMLHHPAVKLALKAHRHPRNPLLLWRQCAASWLCLWRKGASQSQRTQHRTKRAKHPGAKERKLPIQCTKHPGAKEHKLLFLPLRKAPSASCGSPEAQGLKQSRRLSQARTALSFPLAWTSHRLFWPPSGAEVGSAQKDAPLEPASSLAGVHSSLAWDPGREQPGNGILRAALQRSVVAPEMGSIPAWGAHCLEAREGSRARKPTGYSTTTQVQVQPGVGHESTPPTADPQAQAIVWPYPCTICQQTFGRLADLRSHVWAHSSVQCFTCALCQESFGTPHGLAEHEKWHACGEPCSCSLCPRVFMDKAKMVQHQRMHAGEKPFVCGVCGKGFACRPYLVSHRRYMHSDERPHVCAVCGKGFVHKSHLASHAKAHGREMPHECRTCHQRFPYKFHLVSHEMSHAGQELQCEGEPGNTACP